MKYLAGFAVVVASTVAVATAEPGPDESTGRVSYTGQHLPQAISSQCDGSPIELSEPTQAKHGTEFFVIGSDLGLLSKLEIRATKGRVGVQRVRVFYRDGSRKSVRVSQDITRGGTPVSLELGKPKEIDQIVVTTDVSPGAAYTLYGFCRSMGSIATAR